MRASQLLPKHTVLALSPHFSKALHSHPLPVALVAEIAEVALALVILRDHEVNQKVQRARKMFVNLAKQDPGRARKSV